MNDYGEIIKIPYKEREILNILIKLTKYDKIKSLSLEKFDEENNTFLLVGNKPKKLKINIKISELEKGYTQIEITSQTNGFIFTKDKKIVRNIVDLIFKQLESYKKDNTNDDFSVEILDIKNTSKKIRGIISLIIIFYFVFRLLFSIFADDFYINIVNDFWHYPRLQLIWSIITTIALLLISKSRNKSLKRRRIKKLKSILYRLIEEKDLKKNEKDNFKSDEIIKKIGIIPNKVKPYIDKNISYIKKVKEEKPKIFWVSTVTIGIIISWIIIGPIVTPKTLEGEYIQQMGRLSDEYSSAFAHSIKFSDGKAAMSGQGQYYETATWYEYKIKGNKIYVMKNGEEVDTGFTIKNNSTLIYGDGIIDNYCPESGIKGVSLVCGPNFDGTYIKQ